MRKRSKKRFGGESNSSGFEIGFYEKSGSKITKTIAETRSRNYDPNGALKKAVSKKIKVIKFLSLFFLITTILWSSHIIFTGKAIVTVEKNDLFSQILFNSCIYFFLTAISFLITMVMRPNIFFNLYKDSRQWHACEHKVGHLFEKKLPINLGNLRKMRRVHRHCEAVAEFFQVRLPIFLFAAAYLFTFYIGRLGLLSALAVIGVVIVILVVVLNIIVYVFTTSEPTEEQLRETLRVAKEFKAKLEEQGEWR